jgi:citrate synthase
MTDDSRLEKSYGVAEITINGKKVAEFNVVSDTLNSELNIEGAGLRAAGQRNLGMPVNFLDPGFKSTASCFSGITYLKGDGDKAVLLYHGFPVESLADSCGFLEVSYLLYNGCLPTASQLDDFSNSIKGFSLLSEQFSSFCDSYPRETHPMTLLMGFTSTLSSLYDDIDVNDKEQRENVFKIALAKFPTIVAMIYKYSIGEPFVPPRSDLSYTDNFLNMMFSSSLHSDDVSPVMANALEKILLLHADHEQNASTSAVRLVGSTKAQPFASLISGIAALSGPLHGGANEACLRMLEDIGDVDNIDSFIAKAKDPNDPFRLMGFGHRVYHSTDPRAEIMRGICHSVLKNCDLEDKIFHVALELEKRALEDDYFKERKLYPNVDFYSGITLRAMGIPMNMFTVIFALGRISGWLSQWNEMHENGFVISRPRQCYTGSALRNPNL